MGPLVLAFAGAFLAYLGAANSPDPCTWWASGLASGMFLSVGIITLLDRFEQEDKRRD